MQLDRASLELLPPHSAGPMDWGTEVVGGGTLRTHLPDLQSKDVNTRRIKFLEVKRFLLMFGEKWQRFVLPNMGLQVWLITSRQTDPDLKISYPPKWETISINKMNQLEEECKKLLSSRNLFNNHQQNFKPNYQLFTHISSTFGW